MKKYISITALLLLVSISLTACTKNVPSNENGMGEQQDSTAVDGEEKYEASLMDLMKLGKNVKCTYEFESDQESRKVETYVAGDKTKSIITIVTPDGMEITTSTITDGDTMYLWNSEDMQGMIINISDSEDQEVADISETGDSYKYSDQNQKIDYKCIPWNPSPTEFDVPSDVNFVDYENLIQRMMLPTE